MPPVYAGPTPADPFGGQVFDIFDAMELAEQAEPVWQATVEILPTAEPAPVPAPAEPPPAIDAELDIPRPPSPPAEEMPLEEAAPEAANDPEPLIKPIMVGADEQPAEKKRGWWRR